MLLTRAHAPNQPLEVLQIGSNYLQNRFRVVHPAPCRRYLPNSRVIDPVSDSIIFVFSVTELCITSTIYTIHITISAGSRNQRAKFVKPAFLTSVTGPVLATPSNEHASLSTHHDCKRHLPCIHQRRRPWAPNGYSWNITRNNFPSQTHEWRNGQGSLSSQQSIAPWTNRPLERNHRHSLCIARPQSRRSHTSNPRSYQQRLRHLSQCLRVFPG
jgi:hypothetical protein